jgi:cephalosporin hydroxylase
MTALLKELFYAHDERLLHKWDHYFDIYEKYFSIYKGQKINLLEIGISHGGSIQLWKKYFGENLNLFAIDINPECKKFEENGVKIFIGSQEDSAFMKSVSSQLPELDIIIDDGGHTMKQQIESFEILFDKLRQSGIYLIEDTHTSYWRYYGGGFRKRGTFIEYSKKLIDVLYDGHLSPRNFKISDEIRKNINCISFYDSIVVFEKKKRDSPFHLMKGKSTIVDYSPKLDFISWIKNKIPDRNNKTFMKNFRRENQ